MSTPGSPSAVSLNTNPSLGVQSGPICGKPGKSEHDGGEPVVDSGDNIVQQLQVRKDTHTQCFLVVEPLYKVQAPPPDQLWFIFFYRPFFL